MKTVREFREETLNESSLSRIWRHTQKHETGTISAFRYASNCNEGDVFTKGQNKARNQKLKAQLLRAGYGVTVVAGTYIENYGTKEAREVDEESFFVVDYKDQGGLEKSLRKFGEVYEQDSVTFSKVGGKDYYLIGTNKCEMGYPGFGKRVKLGKAFFSDSGEFYSKVNGRPFIFKNVVKEQTTIDEVHGYAARMALGSVADGDWNETYELNKEIYEEE